MASSARSARWNRPSRPSDLGAIPIRSWNSLPSCRRLMPTTPATRAGGAWPSPRIRSTAAESRRSGSSEVLARCPPRIARRPRLPLASASCSYSVGSSGAGSSPSVNDASASSAPRTRSHPASASGRKRMPTRSTLPVGRIAIARRLGPTRSDSGWVRHRSPVEAFEPVGEVEDQLRPAVGHGPLKRAAGGRSPRRIHSRCTRPRSSAAARALGSARYPTAASRLACWYPMPCRRMIRWRMGG